MTALPKVGSARLTSGRAANPSASSHPIRRRARLNSLAATRNGISSNTRIVRSKKVSAQGDWMTVGKASRSGIQNPPTRVAPIRLNRLKRIPQCRHPLVDRAAGASGCVVDEDKSVILRRD